MAALVGLEETSAALWRVFSNVVKHEQTIQFKDAKRDRNALYSYYEDIVTALRTLLREGVRSVILVSPAKSNFAKQFLAHVQMHHAWLTHGTGGAVFSEVAGSAVTLPQVAAFVRSVCFHEALNRAAEAESNALVELFEQRLNAIGRGTLVFYSLEEIERLIFGEWKENKSKPEFLLIADTFLADCRVKNRVHRLMQVAVNRGVKSRVIPAKSAVGVRVAQFGGIVLLCNVV
ncbi:MAG: hypothetical protein QXU99_06255 [Candidatus Bathyarchaeia archaeon]